MNNEAGITMNNEAGRALKSTSNQSSEPCEVVHYFQQKCVQGGEDPQHALSFEVIFRKRALQLVALGRKETCNLRHPMHLSIHPTQTNFKYPTLSFQVIFRKRNL